MYEVSATHSRPEYMRKVTAAVGEALQLDVSVHSVSGHKAGRPVSYPAKLLRVVKSRETR